MIATRSARVGGDVDDFDVVALEDVAIVGVDCGFGIELRLRRARPCDSVRVAEGDDVDSRRAL